jgi:hypothetical protein
LWHGWERDEIGTEFCSETMKGKHTLKDLRVRLEGSIIINRKKVDGIL